MSVQYIYIHEKSNMNLPNSPQECSTIIVIHSGHLTQRCTMQIGTNFKLQSKQVECSASADWNSQTVELSPQKARVQSPGPSGDCLEILSTLPERDSST